MDIKGNVSFISLDRALSWSHLHLPEKYHDIIEFYNLKLESS